MYSLANFYREDHNYVVAHSLYGRALAAAEKVATLEDNGRALVARIRKDQQAMSEILNGEKGA